MKQQVTLALSLTLAAGLLAGCADTTGGSQPTGAAKHPLRMPHRARRRAPPLPTR